METVDFKTLLDSSHQVTAPKQQNTMVSINLTDEPRKEGMKAAAFELLKALLTGNQIMKTETTEYELTPPTTPPVMSPVAEVPNLILPESPILEPTSLHFSNTLENNVTFDMLLDDNNGHVNPFESLIQPELSIDNVDLAEIEPSTDGPLIASIELLDTISTISPSHLNTISISSPNVSFKGDDYESSIMSSEPSSPYITVDTSQFSDSEFNVSYQSSQVSEKDFTLQKSKSRKEKSRASPFDSDYDNVYDKRSRKKVQNKNAATRYRVKKRMEKETLQEQEVRLSDTNKELREKVDSLAREIKYMKELMTEINKAKQRKH